ncbi:uncharacterized protein SCHCODRAFT_02613733 [Schizophyllum commune H4-8]|uniref:uncharacterized protein n=1 Tax=Schizophyllum commune (strain H4-8 / FGSC 9210) TaxID=578458 RepID=UPI002160774A|nr:uncharacterized protein SCHCODRAFT_02613733 [Schizophyllum commune H4-8]KAI5895986.1 hypothetical protein SCHCODRAFT_02613733 [Schizophyllum commune H4-8]
MMRARQVERVSVGVETDPPVTPRAGEKRRRAEDQFQSDTAGEERPPSPARPRLDGSPPAPPAHPTRSNAAHSSGSQATVNMSGRRPSTRAANAASASTRASSSDGGPAHYDRPQGGQATTAARAAHFQARHEETPTASSSTSAPLPSRSAAPSSAHSLTTSRHARLLSSSAGRDTGHGSDSDSDNVPLGRPPKSRKPTKKRRAARRVSTSDEDYEYEPPAAAQSPTVSERRVQRPRRKAAPTQLKISELSVDSESPDDGDDAPNWGAGSSSKRRSSGRLRNKGSSTGRRQAKGKAKTGSGATQLYAGEPKPAKYKIGGAGIPVPSLELKPGDFIYETREDGTVPDTHLVTPEYIGDDSESDVDPKETTTDFIKEDGWGDPDIEGDDAVPVTMSKRAWCRRLGSYALPERGEGAVNFCEVVGPAYPSQSPHRRPSGVVVRRLQLVPVEIAPPSITPTTRYPELVRRADQTDIVPNARIEGKVCRVLMLAAYGALVVDQLRKPCFPPADYNDLWSRFDVVNGGVNTGDSRICLDGRCKASPKNTWNPSRYDQVRWCARCTRFFHTLCMKRQIIADIAAHAGRLDAYGQPYLRYLLEQHTFLDDEPRRMRYGFTDDAADHNDVHDGRGLFPMPQTTWQEVAVLPIRRRTFPMETPETNEVVIQHAIQQVLDGHGADAVPDVSEWLHGISPQAGLRGAKFILNKNLRQLRHGKPPRRYLCPGCQAQII